MAERHEASVFSVCPSTMPLPIPRWPQSTGGSSNTRPVIGEHVSRLTGRPRAPAPRSLPSGRVTSDEPGHPHLAQLRDRILAGGPEKYHAANAEKGKLFARERIGLLVDEGSFVEDGLYANAVAGDLPADGVVTGTATVDGRQVWLMANDSTVKAGSWGARTVEKIIRAVETAYRTGTPMVWLVDSAGARLTDPGGRFPRPRGAGRLFPTQAGGAGRGPPGGALFRPSAPRPARRGPHLPHAGAGVGQRAAGVCSVRPERRRWRLHSCVLRRGRHGRRQRLDVPRLGAHGRDGRRREDDARGDGRGEDALLRLRRRPLPRSRRAAGDRPRPPLPVLPAVQLDAAAAADGAG